MKNRVIFVASLFALALLFWGCKDTQEELITNTTGLWKITTRTSQRYDNDSLTYDRTRADSLGTLEFRMTGQGFRTDGAGVRDTFVWGLSPDDARLVINYKIGPFMDATISDRTETAMTLSWIERWNEGTSHVRTENEEKIEKQ